MKRKQKKAPPQPYDRLSALLEKNQQRLDAYMREQPGGGVVFTQFFEGEGKMIAAYFSVDEAQRLIDDSPNVALQQAYALFRIMTALAPWMAIIVAQLITAEDRTYSAVVAVDMLTGEPTPMHAGHCMN